MRRNRYAVAVLVVTGALAAGCGSSAMPVSGPSAVPSAVVPAATPPTPSGLPPEATSLQTSGPPTAATVSTVSPSATPGTPGYTHLPASAGSGAAAPSYSISMPALPPAVNQGLVEGADASWPQCPKGMGIAEKRTQGEPMPLSSARFVVLGLTNGPGFVANPCLDKQVAWVKQRHLLAAAYSIISTPRGNELSTYGDEGPYDASTRSGRLANVGFQEARFNIGTMQGAGLETPVVWLDIEPVTHFDWPADTAANAAVVEGAEKGYEAAGYRVGVYSLPSLWRRVVGTLALTLPEWRPAGATSRSEALARCRGAWMFQGGAAVLAQWTDGDRDRDVTCPGQSVYLSLWFHQY